MKFIGKIVRDYDGEELECPVCGGNSWEHIISKETEGIRYRCTNGCTDLLHPMNKKLDSLGLPFCDPFD